MGQIKKEIMLILSCIGTSFGVVGTAAWGLYLGIKHMDLLTIWGSAIGIGITLFGLGVWSTNLIIAVKQYLRERKLQGGIYTTPKIRFLSNTAILKVDEKEKSKQKGGSNAKRNSEDN